MAGWQFRKSKKLFPGVRLNVSQKGVGFSVGGPAGRVGISPSRKRVTFSQSIPGSGLRRQKSFSVAQLKAQTTQSSLGATPTPLYSTSFYEANKTKFYKIGFRVWMVGFLTFIIGVFIVQEDNAFLGAFLAYDFLLIFSLGIALLISRARNLRKTKQDVFNNKQETLHREEVQQAKHLDELNYEKSIYSRDPQTPKEWQTLLDDLKDILSGIESLEKKVSDNSKASEFPVKKGEVIFYKSIGYLTDYDAVELMDGGHVYLTNLRVAFLGSRKTNNWTFSKMTVPLSFDEKQLAIFQSTEYKKVSGVKVPEENWLQFRFYLMMVYAAQLDLSRLSSELKTSIANCEAAKPE
jgi:hypothetical protein